MRLLSCSLAIFVGSTLCEAVPTAAVHQRAAATTSVTSTTCTTFAVTATPTSYHCDIGGTLKHPDTIGSPSKLTGSAAKILTLCRNRCLANGSCLSFAIDENKSQCILYMKTLGAQGIRNPGKDTNTVRYDRKCFTSTCSIVTTTTTTSTPVGTPGCGSVPAPTFGLLVVGGSHDGLRGFLQGNDQLYDRELQFTQYNTTANQIFALDAECHLTNDNGIAHTYTNATYTDLGFDSPAHIAASSNPSYVPATCDTSSGYLSCVDQTDNTLCLTDAAPQHIQIGPDLPAAGCEAITLQVLFM